MQEYVEKHPKPRPLKTPVKDLLFSEGSKGEGGKEVTKLWVILELFPLYAYLSALFVLLKKLFIGSRRIKLSSH